MPQNVVPQISGQPSRTIGLLDARSDGIPSRARGQYRKLIDATIKLAEGPRGALGELQMCLGRSGP